MADTGWRDPINGYGHAQGAPVGIIHGEAMQDETKVLKGVCKSLDGLIDVMEALPDTTDNVDLWQAIGEAAQIAKMRIKR